MSSSFIPRYLRIVIHQIHSFFEKEGIAMNPISATSPTNFASPVSQIAESAKQINADATRAIEQRSKEPPINPEVAAPLTSGGPVGTQFHAIA